MVVEAVVAASLLFNIGGVNVFANIGDRTSMQGVTPRAMAILRGAAAGAKRAGLTSLVVTAGKGGGHKSHSQGTELDLKGYSGNKLWTPEQRVIVAEGGRASGADRFGLYSFGKGFTGNGSLHIGYSGPGRPAAVWGYGGKTSGNASRAFTNPAEKSFLNRRYKPMATDVTAKDDTISVEPKAPDKGGIAAADQWDMVDVPGPSDSFGDYFDLGDVPDAPPDSGGGGETMGSIFADPGQVQMEDIPDPPDPPPDVPEIAMIPAPPTTFRDRVLGRGGFGAS